MSGSRGNLFAQIDALRSLADSGPEFTEALIRILKVFAYHAVTDGGLMESQEEWHEEFNAALKNAARSDAASKAKAATASRAALSSRDTDRDAASARHRAMKKIDKQHSPSNLPDSLRKLMDGTHTSLNDGGYNNDDY